MDMLIVHCREVVCFSDIWWERKIVPVGRFTLPLPENFNLVSSL